MKTAIIILIATIMTACAAAQSVTFKGVIVGTDSNEVNLGVVVPGDTVWVDVPTRSMDHDNLFNISGIDSRHVYVVRFRSGGMTSTYTFDLDGITRRRKLVVSVDFSSPAYLVTWSRNTKSLSVSAE